jgi:hypothetical protein
MIFKQITTYKFDGKIFNSIKEVQVEIENRLGAIIDKMDPTLNSKQRLNILNSIINNRETIKILLNVCDEEGNSIFNYTK